ncbi:ABC transporter substrate-binding protein [Pseudorhodoferax sp. Leaf267]|uniref:ABC transporter substrate-binding protein n=1 Tax=Pseudorhodoferax sp. Leaf267 TaxID=1736316 RepID=UPI0006F8C58B|nr:extracellular solute-binding protein [Pseudorhodoferax sp. Leaf267]KQP13176.1 ABC transporter substrate-binding protein [Pseudorhodoferax sp. Leaf267]
MTFPSPLRPAAVLAAALLATLAQAGTVSVVTSFPKELTQAYKTAFEKANPDIKLEILNKSTTAGVAYVRELSAGQRPEIFWASAPDAFEVLGKARLLERIADLANPAAPKDIAGYPINDPDGLYLGQALGGYGLMWNTRYLAAKKLPAPAEWADLTKPVYHSHVALSSPSRSGTTHLTVEAILQGEGWDKGWRQLMQIAGNSSAITERSFGVPDGVNNGQFGIGLVIDFFGLSGKFSGFPVEFAYPSVTAVVPANIALVAGGKNPGEARRFISFALSREGQELLTLPQLARLPVLPPDQMKMPAGYPNAFEVAKRAKVKFDADLSAARYYLVTALFDQAITFRHKELQAASAAIHQADAALAARPNADGAARLQRARELAFTPPVSEAMAKDATFLNLFTSNKKNADTNKEVTATESSWNTKALENYRQAKQLADEARALAK